MHEREENAINHILMHYVYNFSNIKNMFPKDRMIFNITVILIEYLHQVG